jgi:hypothetical protein
MGFLVSPGVEVKETDLTNIIPALATSVGGFAGFFKWGPVGTPINISSELELARTFGRPTEAGEFETSFLTAASYLNYSNTLRVVRADDETSTNSVAGPIGFSQSGSYKINSLDTLLNSKTLLESDDIRFVSRYVGSIGNSIGVAVIDSTSGSIPARFRGALRYTPDKTAWSENQKEILGIYDVAISDELSIVIFDRLGEITGTAGEILEVFEGISYFSGAKDSFNQSAYWVDVLNNRSSFVWGVAHTADLSGQGDEYLAVTSLASEAYNLTGATDAVITSAAPIVEALDLFSDSETIDINFLFAHNFIDNGLTGSIDDKLISVVESRKDALAFISAPIGVASETNDADRLSAVIDKFNALPSTSYAVFDSTPVYVYNRYRDGFAWIPASGHMAGLCAKTDRLNDPWFSPAGFNRGNLLGVTKIAYNPKQIDRDDLYTARINPIISSPGNGIVLYGDKTALSKPSAFDRINVRRLFITIEKAIATAAKFLLFELNDEFTRAAFRNSVVPYLRNIQGRRGIIDFRVICDESNNTPDVVDSNRFVGTIYVKPTRSINAITLNFVAVRSGVTFEEVIGSGAL